MNTVLYVDYNVHVVYLSVLCDIPSFKNTNKMKQTSPVTRYEM